MSTYELGVDEDAVCPTCGGEFKSNLGMKQHHARTHGESIAVKEYTCGTCGDAFRRKPSQMRGSDNAFCSKACYAEHMAARSPSTQPRWEGGKVTIECNYCGRDYERYPNRADESKYCSASCRSQAFGDRVRHDRLELSCEQCGSGFEVPEYQTDRRFCSRLCWAEWRSENQRGIDHHGWRGGRDTTDAVRRNLTPRWQQARREERQAAGHCHLCGGEFGSTTPDIHHIIPVMAGGVNESALLMPMCRSCHQQVERYTWKIPEIAPVLTE